ncbi:hypothetical protein COEREDRAFT_82945 [Coemansia reversa NRRL 1564]|uniref:Uncharacterized protein n=1 Tax=Coemansia reversa (strain ATCC 12441 / NRRL 1564) TaxID=763665 RepID=A0A2G5B549_COERN|nr:hypothetical protein COEREDRAFT_82945 [Coemansia reversa NRRL 1564]|eukprot:PIA14120.1 hypothetical protein COEREDRAFT_82945 [Coemansia reversa NRRL 1564]
MLQCRGLRFSQNYLALYGGAPVRILNAQTAWRFSRLYASATKDTTSDQQGPFKTPKFTGFFQFCRRFYRLVNFEINPTPI